MSTPSAALFVSGHAQDVPVLRTKLYVPRVRPELVSRPRLVERLKSGLSRKLTLVSAPAGFGKTTLLSECAAVCDLDMRMAWVSLDEGDSDPVRFWYYVIAALQTVEPDLGSASLTMLRSAGVTPPPIESLLTGLINEIAELPMPRAPVDRHLIVLVLDDFHLITEPKIHEGLTFLLDNLPPQLRLVVCGRADPPWPLARLRARRELTELRAPDLRFNAQEAAAFLNDAMGLALSAEDVAALEARTEGWIAGLQMAAISMRERRHTDGAHSLPQFVRAFTGSHRFVLDYLVEEVLDQQPDAIRDFLLQTSILERLTARLCDALVGEAPLPETGGSSLPPAVRGAPPHSQAILEALEAANLFLIPLDDERRWYRYHRLFADLLRRRFAETHPEGLGPLHRRASTWHAENGYAAEAVGHALAAGDLEQAADIVERNVLAFKDHGELPTVLRWLDAFPQEVIHTRPWLCVARAWTLAYVGQLDATEPLLQSAEQLLAEREVSDETRHVQGHIAAIRAFTTLFHLDLPLTATHGYAALDLLPDWDVQTRQSAATTLASALRLGGDLTAAGRVLSDAIAMSRSKGNDQTTVRMLCGLAALQITQLRFRDATATLDEAIRLAEKDTRPGTTSRLPAAGHAYIRLSSILLEQYRLDAALRYATEGIKLCKQWGQANALWEGHQTLAQICQAMGDDQGAFGAWQEAERIAAGLSTWAQEATAADRAATSLAAGDPELAIRWAEESGISLDGEFGYENLILLYLYVRARHAQAGDDHAHLLEIQAAVNRLLGSAQASGAKSSEVALLAFKAIVCHQLGDAEQALTTLEQALSLAEPEESMFSFVLEGAPMVGLLKQALARGVATEFVSKLLAIMERKTTDGGRPPQRPRDAAAVHPWPVLAEPLTERELEVLQLLSSRLSSLEIADQLYISVSTVRTHIKNIYGKLRVHSRLEAIERAQELDLL